jgi:uncharacterized protein (TIGR02246 family)
MTDEEMIRRKIAEYANMNDGQDVEGFAALFAADGRFVSSTSGVVSGHEAIKRFVQGTFAQKGPHGRAQHVYTNAVINVDGDTADAVVDCVEYRRVAPDAPWHIHQIGKYHDRFVKQGERWLFSEIRYVKV